MVTAVQEGFQFSSPVNSSGKQKKMRSTTQPDFLNENTTAPAEADRRKKTSTS